MSSAELYRQLGVDLQAAESAKQQIARAVESTRTALARGSVGDFGGMVRLPEDVPDPVLVMSTDGVGTKVLVAIRAGRHDTIGEDLVNHCVNDILVHGARPLSFQDYIAGNSVEPTTTSTVVDGIARACSAHEMVLTGGETAQLPDLYRPGHYDLAGTIVGVVSEDQAIYGERIKPGDLLVAYESNGLHTNGYTLARSVVFDTLGLDVDAMFPGTQETVAEVLLKVHHSYYSQIVPVLRKVHGIAHVTGGGIKGNLSRIVPSGCGARVDLSTWEPANIFTALRDAGSISSDEMYAVFNMGVGMITVVSSGEADSIMAAASPIRAWVMGEVVAGDGVVLE